jgi:Putative zinc-finger
MHQIEGNEEPMECRDVRDRAEPYLSGHVPVEDARAISTHLGGCPACHAEIEDLRRLRGSLRSAYLASTDLAPAPEFVSALRSQLRAAVERREAGSSWRHTWLALAATIALVVGGGFGVRGLGVSGFTAILHAAVGDHRFCLVAFKLAERPIPLERAAQLYDDPVDRLLDRVEPGPAQLSGGPVRIVERHSCVYDGRRFAHIVLRYKGALISLVVTPDERLLRALPGASAPADGSIASLPPTDGFQVAAFRGPHHVVFLVSSLGDDELGDVAESMRASVSRALNGL